MLEENSEKIFIITNFLFFGDTLLTNTLCYNIKKYYPNSKIIFLTSKPFKEAAQYQKYVDEAYELDKRGEHKSIKSLYKFAQNFPYKDKIYAVFVMNANDRGILLGKFLKAKHIVSSCKKFKKIFLTKNQIDNCGLVHMQDIYANYIRALTNEAPEIVPIEYIPPETEDKFIENIKNSFDLKKTVALCTTSKLSEKDMPIDTAIELIRKLKEDGKTIFLYGAGKTAREYADELKRKGCLDFIDLTNVTSISQMARLLKQSETLISVDTGTLHLGNAVKVPTVAVFYKQDLIEKWAPRAELYKTITVSTNLDANGIFNAYKKLLA